ncbi:uncharacterized protein LOC132270445 [Cornus florida]|uniref:uncharacterized protein LOC132270445 n=1 Tax=Cornus florida TaxID=4283 RepID=UPI0028978DCB|nr:uncharacterized protein LOC132270445 [Cornus florida]
MGESHLGICGAHQAGIKMRWLLRRYGYYWKGTLNDCIEFIKTYTAYQEHSLVQRVLAINMQPVVKICPFRGWALDFIGKLRPPSSDGHTHIVVAIDYFIKWVEAIPLNTYEQSTKLSPLTKASPLFGNKVLDYCAECGVQVISSTPYFAQSNGQAEASNKVIFNILEKIIENNPKEWHHLLSEALWAYKNSKRSSTGITLYMLTYGYDAILPMEMTIRSARVAFQNNLTPADYNHAMLVELEDLDEVRVNALDYIIAQKKKVMWAYNKKVKA